MADMTSEYLQSRVFDFLRFPLIFCVVLIHVTLTGHDARMLNPEYADYTTALFFSELFSHTIASIAVPLFFLISGYLFFYKTDFTVNTYFHKLRKRTHSLLIPYLIWNTLWLVSLFVFVKLNIKIGTWVESDFTLETCLSSYWGMKHSGMPIAYQFWFIRDLIVCVLFSPLVWVCIRFIKVGFVLILGCAWFFSGHFSGIDGFSSIAWFFFSTGAYLSIQNINIAEKSNHFGWWWYILYPLFVAADVLTKGAVYNPYLHHVGILAGMIFALKLVTHLIASGKVGVTPFLTAASFFIFAMHEPWIKACEQKFIGQHLPTQESVIILHYFLCPFIIVGLCLFIFFFMKRYLPKITATITGGRL